MQYFIRKESDYRLTQNKLQEAIREMLTEHDNTLIKGEGALERFLGSVTYKLERLHQQHKQCKKIHTHIWSGTKNETWVKRYYMGVAGDLVVYPVKREVGS